MSHGYCCNDCSISWRKLMPCVQNEEVEGFACVGNDMIVPWWSHVSVCLDTPTGTINTLTLCESGPVVFSLLTQKIGRTDSERLCVVVCGDDCNGMWHMYGKRQHDHNHTDVMYDQFHILLSFKVCSAVHNSRLQCQSLLSLWSALELSLWLTPFSLTPLCIYLVEVFLSFSFDLNKLRYKLSCRCWAALGLAI